MNQNHNKKSPYKKDNSGDPPKGKIQNSFALRGMTKKLQMC